MPDHAVSGPFAGSAIPHVGTYRRVLPVTLERMYENALDWEHLPHVHASSFASIDCQDYGAWGWRAEVTNPSGQRMLLELRLDREHRRWITRNLEGPAKGAEIWTHAFHIGPEQVDINVDFFVPGVPEEAREKVGRAYARAYETLYDEDVAMMVERERQIRRRVEPLPVGEAHVGGVEEIEALLEGAGPVLGRYAGRDYRITRVGGAWVAFPTLCPHQLGPLDTAPVQDGIVRCPWHGYDFDVVTGECVSGSTCRFSRRPEVQLRDGDLYLVVPEG